ncbi:MAG: YfhO family protein [Bdellovibrionales bacterium]
MRTSKNALLLAVTGTPLFVMVLAMYQKGLHFHNIDMLDVLYPSLYTFFDHLRNGELLLWNPFVGLGHTAIFWAHFPLAPLSLPHLAFGLNDGSIQLEIFLGFWITCFLVAKILAYAGVEPILSAAISLAFMSLPLVGQYSLHIVHMNAIAFAPLTVLTALRWKKENLVRGVALCAVALALGMQGSKAELWMFNGFLLAFCMFAMGLRHRRWSLIILSVVGSVVLAALMTSVQISLILGVIRDSPRVSYAKGLSIFSSLEFYRNGLNYLIDNPNSGIVLWAFGLTLLRKMAADRFRIEFLPLLAQASLLVVLATNPNCLLRPLDLAIYLLFAGATFLLQKRGWGSIEKSLPWIFLTDLAIGWIWFSTIQTFYEFERNVGYLQMPVLLNVLSGLAVAGISLFRPSFWIRFSSVGIIFIILLRYYLQYPLIQVTGAIWHPSRDNYVYYLFLIIPAALSLQALFSAISASKIKRWLPYVFLVLCSLFLWKNLLRNSDFMKKAPYGFSGPGNIPELSNLAKMTKVSHQRVLAIPGEIPEGGDPWTADFAFNPNVLQYYGLYDSAFYDSTPARRYHDFVNKLNFGDAFDPSNTIVNHWFPQVILRYIPGAVTDLSERELFKRYSYMRLIPNHYNNRWFAITNTHFLITRADLFSPPYQTWLQGTDGSLFKEISKFKFESSKSPEREYRIYQVKNQGQYAQFFPKDSPDLFTADCLGASHLKKGDGELRMDSDESQSKVLSLRAKEDGWIVLSEAYHPSWRATIGGEKVDPKSALCGVLALPVKEGDHRIEFRFQSQNLAIWSWISLLSVMGCVFVIVLPYFTARLSSRRESFD